MKKILNPENEIVENILDNFDKELDFELIKIKNFYERNVDEIRNKMNETNLGFKSWEI